MSEEFAKERAGTRARSWLFALITFSGGIPTGFLTVAFPFLATEAGMSLVAVGGIVGTALLANTLTLLWSPIVDLTLSLRHWVVLGSIFSATALVALVLIPLGPEMVVIAAAVAFLSQAAATLPLVAGGALMALAVGPTDQARAAGYWQAGLLFSGGIGGGAGLWLATHSGAPAAGLAMALLCLPAVAAVLMIREPGRPRLGETFPGRMKGVGHELLRLARDPRGLLVISAFCTPIGVGAASFLWGGIADEWGAGAGQVALVTGFGAASASGLGALLFGRFAGRFDRMLVFLTTGSLLAAAAVALALLPRTPSVFTVGTLAYALLLGAAYGAFTSLILEVVGNRAAATKYSLLYAFGNIPVAYMPVLNGWVHDLWSTSAMLLVEAGLGLAFVLLYLVLRSRTRWGSRSAAAHRAQIV